MARDQITLSGSTRSTLLSLQTLSGGVEKTQQRLATGREVNSAIDDALSFFTARALSDRAGDLATIKDGLNDAIRTIEAALKGTESIEDTLKQMKALAAAARSSSDSDVRQKYAEQFDELRDQIDNLTEDASYAGVNLIKSVPDSLTVKMNEQTGDQRNEMTVAGEALDATTLGISTVSGSGSASSSSNSVVIGFFDYLGGNKTAFDDWVSGGGNYTLDRITNYPNVSQSAYHVSTGVIGGTAQADSEMSSSDLSALSPAAMTNFKTWANAYMSAGSFQTFDGFSTNTFNVTQYDMQFHFTSSSSSSPSSSSGSWTGSDYVSQIDASIDQIDTALQTTRRTAQTLGSYSSMLQIREAYTTELINTLKTGADGLVNADINEESANMLSLQTRQSLGTTSLSIAQQSERAVLRAF